MAEIKFKDLEFNDDNDKIKVVLYRLFYFHIPRNELENIADFKIGRNHIEFKDVSEKKANNKFNSLLSKYFPELKYSLNNNKAIYIHQNSGIPLIGNSAIGLVDRNTNIIEVKPLTGCNLNCIFCSVDEGISTKKKVDFVVEKDYLVQGFRKLVEYKQCDEIEAHINTHGEPLLYSPIVELVRDLKNTKGVRVISIDTNGMLLTKELVDKLAEAGMTRINLSLNALDDNLAKKMAGTSEYNIEHIKKIARYIPEKMDLIISPVWVPGMNDKDMPKIIEFAKKVGAGKNFPPLGIQNFLNYKQGRNPVKQIPWEEFYERLEYLEKEHDIKLKDTFSDFNVKPTKKLPQPFKKNDVIKATVVCEGRYKGEKIAASKERSITLPNCKAKVGDLVKVKITRSKHNIFYALSL